MIQVTIGTNTTRNKIIVDENKTVKETLESNDIDYSKATIHLDGAPLSAAEMQSTFAALNVTESCFLTSVVKSSCA